MNPLRLNSMDAACAAWDHGTRGYSVRPSSSPLEPPPASSPQDGAPGGALRAQPKSGADNGARWSPPGRSDFDFEESPSIQIHRVTCQQDFPSTWQPARRIITFMGGVSLACTLLVVAIILVAVALSRSANHRQLATGPAPVVYMVPHPRKFANRTPTIVVQRQNPRFWRQHVDELNRFLRAYREKQIAVATSSCDLHYAPVGVSSCSFPLDRISDNCSALNNFGYDTGSPCVALVFNSFAGWTPTPYNLTDPREIPEDLRGRYDPHMLHVTCRSQVITPVDKQGSYLEVQYSPFPGFPTRFLPTRGISGSLPPLVMVQFVGSSSKMDVEVHCTIWAKNLPSSNTHNGSNSGSIRFSLFIF